MATFIAFLRGVNINGITLRMADVRDCLVNKGLTDVRTVLASGNVVFNAADDADQAGLKTQVESALGASFGYDAWVVLITASDLRRVVRKFPFDSDDPGVQPYVVFGSDQGVLDALLDSAPELDPAVEALEAGKGVIYWRCPKGASVDTAFAKHIAKVRYRTTTTNRNLRTLKKVLAIAA